MDLLQFAIAVHTIGQKHGASVTSWFRSERHNQDVGGDPNSLHRYGLAVDLVFDEPADRLKAAVAFHRAGLHTLDEQDHLHVQAWEFTHGNP